MSWREVEPRPSRLWVRHLPRHWPACDRPYLDPVGRRIVWPGGGSSAPALPALAPPGEVCWLPPVGEERSGEKASLVAALARSGSVVLDQHRAGAASSPVAPALAVADLLVPLLERDLAAFDAIAPGSLVLMPLLPGLSDDPASWSNLLARLAPRGPSAVLGVTPELAPLDRRRLVERLGEASFEAVHHGAPPAARLARAFACSVAAAGLSPFWERPTLPVPPRAARNRELAAALATAGELWLALGRSEGEGEALLAAARHVDGSSLDLGALAREGQLALLAILSPLARQVVDQLVRNGRSSLLAELRAEFLAGEPGE